MQNMRINSGQAAKHRKTTETQPKKWGNEEHADEKPCRRKAREKLEKKNADRDGFGWHGHEHPQPCVYPHVCLGIAHVSGKGPLPGQGVWQIHNVSALFAQGICSMRKGQIHCVSTRLLVPERAFKAKSGNLNLFLRILPFFPWNLQGKQGEKGAKCPEKGLDYQILPSLPDTWAIPKHTSGKTQVWGWPNMDMSSKFRISR